MNINHCETPEILTHYINMWNETNLDNIRAHLDLSVADDCIWSDPQHFHVGKKALEENVKRFRTKFPHAQLLINSKLDCQNSRYRYKWIIKSGETIMIHGFDVTTLNKDGFIERVDGFFGELNSFE